ncbi:MAG: MerR family transcriptional regulator [Acidimicrobiia bacterium]|jgi:DNA-binding transcriptional MerR regulator
MSQDGAPPPGSEPGPAPTGGCWRIDDLARRADVTVDTIRYYQREGLMPPAERAGRVNLYGPEHLERLDRIKDLQARRFSLAAIRAVISDAGGGVVEGIFGDIEGGTYTLEEVVERSGIDAELVADVRAAGLLREPAEYGRDAYDGDDLDLLRALAELHALGLPRKAVVELARTYAVGIEATQRSIVELFTGGGELDWEGDELLRFQTASAQHAPEILPIARRLVDYTHQRTIQRLTLGAIERGVIEAAPPADA